jgi:hypothetical protein
MLTKWSTRRCPYVAAPYNSNVFYILNSEFETLSVGNNTTLTATSRCKAAVTQILGAAAIDLDVLKTACPLPIHFW